MLNKMKKCSNNATTVNMQTHTKARERYSYTKYINNV